MFSEPKVSWLRVQNQRYKTEKKTPSNVKQSLNQQMFQAFSLDKWVFNEFRCCDSKTLPLCSPSEPWSYWSSIFFAVFATHSFLLSSCLRMSQIALRPFVLHDAHVSICIHVRVCILHPHPFIFFSTPHPCLSALRLCHWVCFHGNSGTHRCQCVMFLGLPNPVFLHTLDSFHSWPCVTKKKPQLKVIGWVAVESSGKAS